MNISLNTSVSSPSAAVPIVPVSINLLAAKASLESDPPTAEPHAAKAVNSDWLKIKLTPSATGQETTDEVKELNNPGSSSSSIVKPFTTTSLVTATVNPQNAASFLKHKPVVSGNRRVKNS